MTLNASVLRRGAIVFVLVALTGCARVQSTDKQDYAGCASLASIAPAPWRFGSDTPFYPDAPAALRGVPHFTAEVADLHLRGEYSWLQRSRVLATIGDCNLQRDPETNPSRCTQVTDAVARARATASEPRSQVEFGLRVEDFPYFTSPNEEFFGLCDAGALSSLERDPSGTCRVWLADNTRQRAVMLVVPAATLGELATIVEQARPLLSDRFGPCAG